MSCCCHNETMLADKLGFISWLMCKSPKYGGGKKRENKKERQTEGGKEGEMTERVGRGKQSVWLFSMSMMIHCHSYQDRLYKSSRATSRLCDGT